MLSAEISVYFVRRQPEPPFCKVIFAALSSFCGRLHIHELEDALRSSVLRGCVANCPDPMSLLCSYRETGTHEGHCFIQLQPIKIKNAKA